MNIWLDDLRAPPDDRWMWVKTAQAAIVWLECHSGVEVIDLDHDLGLESGDGEDVLLWLEAHAAASPKCPVPEIKIHTQNPVARQRMVAIIESIRRLRGDNNG